MLKLFLSALLLCIPVAQSANCFYKTDKLIGNRCYTFITKAHQYKTAAEYCHSHGWYLATVDSQTVANFLASYATTEFGQNHNQFWIGMSRTKDFSLFTWDDGTQVAFTNFDRGFPNTHDFVAENVKNGKWETIPEHRELQFVCSYDPTRTTVVPTTVTTTTVPTTTKKITTVQSMTTVTTTTAVPTTKRTKCPEGFTLFHKEMKCYIVLEYGNDSDYPPVPDNALPLTREAQRCAKYNLELGTVHSAELNDLLRLLIYERFYDARFATVGLRNTDYTVMGGDWHWYDGSRVDFTNFSEDFPKTGDSVAQTSSQGFWVTFTHTAPNEGVVCSVDL